MYLLWALELIIGFYRFELGLTLLLWFVACDILVVAP